MKRILIIGGVAGGASAAARARRLSEDAEIVLFERGEAISFANCGLPYYIGGAITDRKRLLLQTPEGFRRRYHVDVRTRTEVVRIDRAARRLIVRDLKNNQERDEPYDALVLSPGAEPVRPLIPGSDAPGVFTLRNLADTDRIKAAADRAGEGRAVIVGGGYIGLEMAEALRRRGLDVTLVELAKQVFVAADPEMVAPLHQQLEYHGVDLRLGTSVTEIHADDGGLRVVPSDGRAVDARLVILAVGVRPETTLAREAGLELGPTGGIAVDEHMRTSDPAIYAVGDAVEVRQLIDGTPVLIPLAGPANRQGRIAADNILGRPSVYGRTQGTAVCKVFDLTIGMTGLTEKSLRRAGRAYEKIYVHPSSHAGYYPGATPLSLKLLFDPENGKVLGAQAVGASGVDKRIDVLAVAIRAGLTVRDLAEQELAYAPPYGSAKDPINYAGFVATNVLDGDMPVCHAADVVAPGENQLLLDVRTAAEVAAGTIPGAVHVPLDELRGRMGELPREKEILAFCQVGLRGYLATRILMMAGFRCRNLSGGYKTYQAVVGMLPIEEARPREVVDDAGDVKKGDPMPGVELEKENGAGNVAKEVDARGLQCPGPIMRLAEEIAHVEVGRAVGISATDPGFRPDVAAWCASTGHELRSIEPQGAGCRAVVVRRETRPSCETTAVGAAARHKTIVVFSGEFDKAMAAFIIANGAAAMDSRVTMFFTFWGLNVLRREEPVAAKKNLVERMFGWMMPRGAGRLKLSKMNMGGAGLAMIKGIMRRKNVASLPDLIAQAQRAGVRLVACTMSMDLMGIRREELIDGVEEGGVAMYLQNAESGNVNLFI
ncbi:MAG TPA: FAD-dependent oxidoreductase [Thermoguttaceae bacterium]|nr:FAD-dependent oxidoreductase [Thermoguttaceae bacterium]